MGKCTYSPTKNEEKKIVRICKILEVERKRASDGPLGNLSCGQRDKLANLRFLKRMVCAEGPNEFINYLWGVRLSKEAGNEISDILRE